MAETPRLAASLAAAAADINRRTTLPETLQSIVDVARDSLAEIDHVGITLAHKDGTLSTESATDDVVVTLDRLQYDLGEGPCVDSLARGAEPYLVAEHLHHEGRWHDFVLRALPHGVRAVLAVRLLAGTETVGVLNMYSTTSDTIGPETRATAELFAIHAAYAYGHRRQVHHLQAALETRELIGNAVGVVMERYGLDRDRAFEYLVRTAATSQLKLRVVAEELLQEFETRVGRE